MAFDSFDAFVAMGGHGPYVWACYFVFFALSLVLVLWSRAQRKAALQGVARRSTGRGETDTGKAPADFVRVDSSNH
jgi:heme exporter protein D